MPVAEALDRVLEILRTTELYSPQLGTKDEDPHTSDLVGGLMTVSTYCHKQLLINVPLPDFPSSHLYHLACALPLQCQILRKNCTPLCVDFFPLYINNVALKIGRKLTSPLEALVLLEMER